MGRGLTKLLEISLFVGGFLVIWYVTGEKIFRRKKQIVKENILLILRHLCLEIYKVLNETSKTTKSVYDMIKNEPNTSIELNKLEEVLLNNGYKQRIEDVEKEVLNKFDVTVEDFYEELKNYEKDPDVQKVLNSIKKMYHEALLGIQPKLPSIDESISQDVILNLTSLIYKKKRKIYKEKIDSMIKKNQDFNLNTTFSNAEFFNKLQKSTEHVEEQVVRENQNLVPNLFTFKYLVSYYSDDVLFVQRKKYLESKHGEKMIKILKVKKNKKKKKLTKDNLSNGSFQSSGFQNSGLQNNSFKSTPSQNSLTDHTSSDRNFFVSPPDKQDHVGDGDELYRSGNHTGAAKDHDATPTYLEMIPPYHPVGELYQGQAQEGEGDLHEGEQHHQEEVHYLEQDPDHHEGEHYLEQEPDHHEEEHYLEQDPHHQEEDQFESAAPPEELLINSEQSAQHMEADAEEGAAEGGALLGVASPSDGEVSPDGGHGWMHGELSHGEGDHTKIENDAEREDAVQEDAQQDDAEAVGYPDGGAKTEEPSPIKQVDQDGAPDWNAQPEGEEKQDGPVEEAQQESHVEEAQQESHVEEAQQESHVEEAQQESHVEEAQQESHVEEAQQESHVDQTEQHNQEAEKSAAEEGGAVNEELAQEEHEPMKGEADEGKGEDEPLPQQEDSGVAAEMVEAVKEGPPAEELPTGELPKEEYTNEEPNNEEPSHEEPSHEEPSHEEPSHEEPSHEEPSHEEPSHEEPSHEEPSHEEPSHEEPSHEEPSLEEPSHEDPQNEEPAGGKKPGLGKNSKKKKHAHKDSKKKK
ncbi:hypothetical protein PVMG_03474 [Plasmodium vivax Mauritania I]|uniref:Uncharacterized protein n=1 Tax=Plasmodium vivax Mauritania I TaxID=1035515 RepID=A0A0J9VRA8_PLAVI|nr:hypothetical protein PVMG_03474 [Plasmodium vivax Mauritania I]